MIISDSILSRLYPDQIVQNPKEDIEQRTRLADDAFVRICDMVNDSSMVVRAKVIIAYDTSRMSDVDA